MTTRSNEEILRTLHDRIDYHRNEAGVLDDAWSRIWEVERQLSVAKRDLKYTQQQRQALLEENEKLKQEIRNAP